MTDGVSASGTTVDNAQTPRTERGEMSFSQIRNILSDRSLGEKGICRYENERDGDIVTVFSIATRHSRDREDLEAQVIVGRPDEGGQLIKFDF